MTGQVTVETEPGLKRHRLNPAIAALSRNALPVLVDMVTSVTLPLPGSTRITTTPLPVIF